jgi:hypothetical protein
VLSAGLTGLLLLLLLLLLLAMCLLRRDKATLLDAATLLEPNCCACVEPLLLRSVFVGVVLRVLFMRLLTAICQAATGGLTAAAAGPGVGAAACCCNALLGSAD